MEISRLKQNKKEKQETATVQEKAEVNAKQWNTQTNINIKIYNGFHSNIQGKQILQIHRRRKDAHLQHQPTRPPLLFCRSCFVLTRLINLNKERNKRARCLRVDALTINAPPPRLRWENKGGTETAEPKCLEVVWITTKKRLSSK